MKKKILIGMLGVGLAIFNISVLTSSANNDSSLISIRQAFAGNSESGGSKYNERTENRGDVTETATLNGVSYTRSCKYKQIKCSGRGKTDCTPSFSTSHCGVWAEK